MGDRPGAAGPASAVDVVGLGPGGFDRVSEPARTLLLDPERTVVARTLEHPAATELASRRQVTSCDDLYLGLEDFDAVYDAIADRVLSTPGRVVYAVPGSPLVGEFAVERLRRLGGRLVVVHPAESFIDAVLTAVGVDPLRDGFQLLNGHDLPHPLVIDKPTVIGHLDLPEVLADALARLDRVLPEDAEVVVLVGAGGADEHIVRSLPVDVDVGLAGFRTSLYVPPVGGGLVGAVTAMRRLRVECPWDRRQTHHSLARYLVEESHELADALAALPEDAGPGLGEYADVEEELGDVLLQVLFHAAIAAEAGAFDIDDVGEQLRRKLVRRHPHVFGDVEAEDAETVKANWDAIKAEEKGGAPGSVLAGIPTGLPSLSRAGELQRRAGKVGFDWADVAPVLDTLRGELDELEAALDDPDAVRHEIGDVLFSIVNLARHLEVDPELVLRAANHRFEDRFRAMEAMGPLDGLTLEELDERWERAKRG